MISQSETMEARELTELYEIVRQKLRVADTAFRPDASSLPKYNGYHEAAAVLSSFEPEKIKSNQTSSAPEEKERLIADSVLIYDYQKKPKWALVPHVRREVIQQLGSIQALRNALNANLERPQDRIQHMLERYINGVTPKISELGIDDLTAICQIIEWFDGTAILANLPAFIEVNNRLSLMRLIEPLQKLIGEHFSGREEQLRKLWRYVEEEADEDEESEERIAEENQQSANVEELHPSPLMIYGPGGVGKSTLVAKFLLDYTQPGDNTKRIPFAYLDFDRRGLSPEEPATLLVEIIRQLGIQFPESQGFLTRLHEDLLKDLASAARRSQQERHVSERFAYVWNNEERRNYFLENLKATFYSLNLRELPFLLVLDTFEEVQLRRRQHISQLWSFLKELQKNAPALRIIFSGRALLRGYPVKGLKISDFDEKAAEGFLINSGVTSPAMAKEIFRRVGGSPLSLRLATEVFKKEKDKSVKFFQSLEKSQIQGRLYSRVLEHIPDKNVKKLAHPGLILRLITKEIILHVIAKPCGVEVNNIEDAEKLFNKLAEDMTLVVPEGKDALRHIPEVRRLIIKPLLSDQEKKPKILEIQKAAIAYYEKFTEPNFRAEEIYHRLSLKQEHKLIDTRWLPGVEQYLYNAIEELEPAEQAFLASRLKIELDDQILELSSQEDWEKIVEMRASELLQQNEPDKALETLRQRSERLPASRLYLLEAKAYESKGNYTEVLRLITRGLKQTPFTDPLTIDLFVLRAKTSLRLRRFQKTGEYLQMVREAALSQGNDWRFFEATLELLGIKRHLPKLNLHEEWFALLAKEMVSRIVKEQRADENVLMRKIIGVYGAENQEILLQIIGYSGFEGVSQTLLRDLARRIADWDLQYSSSFDESGVLTRAAKIPFYGDIFDAWLTLMAKESPIKIRDSVVSLLSDFEAPEPVRTVLVEIFRVPLWNETVVPETKKATSVANKPENDGLTTKSMNPKGDKQWIKLSGEQLKMIYEALLDAFPTRDSLEQMLLYRLNLKLDAIVFGNSLSEMIFKVVKYAGQTDKLIDLINVARESNPTNSKLVEVAQQLGILSDIEADKQKFEKIIEASNNFLDIVEWRSALAVIENQVCRVEIGSSAKSYGTGFLIGPNLLLTAFHVVESLIKGRGHPTEAAFRFDYKELPNSNLINSGNIFKLAKRNWLVAFSGNEKSIRLSDKELDGCQVQPGLDFAILRLEGNPGQESIGGYLESTAAQRGWIDLNNVAQATEKNRIVILHHPIAGPLKMSVGIAKNDLVEAADSSRIVYQVETQPGSAGAPCFNINWKPLAIHQGKNSGSTRKRGTDGTGTLISAILKSLPTRLEKDVLGIDKIESVFLQNGRILLNRKVLRTALREMLATGGKRILIVNGPSGSGKTYTKEFIYHVTQDIPNTKICAISLHQIYTANHLAEMIGISFGEWTEPASIYDDSDITNGRYLRELANASLMEAFRNPGINRWLIIDDCNFVRSNREFELNREIIDFINHLLENALVKLPELRIVLLGFQETLFPNLQDKVLTENTEPLKTEDIEEFFSKYFLERNQSVSIKKNKNLTEEILRNVDFFSNDEQKIRELTKTLNQWVITQEKLS